MAHQRRADTLPLMFVDHCESKLGNSRPNNDVASAADDEASAGVLGNSCQGYVIDEINVEEERLFAF